MAFCQWYSNWVFQPPGRVSLTRSGASDSAIMRQGQWYSGAMAANYTRSNSSVYCPECDASKEGVLDISGGGRSDTYGESTVGKGGENCKWLENKESSRRCTLPETSPPSAGAEGVRAAEPAQSRQDFPRRELPATIAASGRLQCRL